MGWAVKPAMVSSYSSCTEPVRETPRDAAAIRARPAAAREAKMVPRERTVGVLPETAGGAVHDEEASTAVWAGCGRVHDGDSRRTVRHRLEGSAPLQLVEVSAGVHCGHGTAGRFNSLCVAPLCK